MVRGRGEGQRKFGENPRVERFVRGLETVWNVWEWAVIAAGVIWEGWIVVVTNPIRGRDGLRMEALCYLRQVHVPSGHGTYFRCHC